MGALKSNAPVVLALIGVRLLQIIDPRNSPMALLRIMQKIDVCLTLYFLIMAQTSLE